MDFLRKLWPTPFKIQEKNIVSLIVQLVIFVLIVAVVGWLFSILAGIPIIGVIFGVLGSLIGLYNMIGIILCILKFLGIVK